VRKYYFVIAIPDVVREKQSSETCYCWIASSLTLLAMTDVRFQGDGAQDDGAQDDGAQDDGAQDDGDGSYCPAI